MLWTLSGALRSLYVHTFGEGAWAQPRDLVVLDEDRRDLRLHVRGHHDRLGARVHDALLDLRGTKVPRTEDRWMGERTHLISNCPELGAVVGNKITDSRYTGYCYIP